VNLFKYYGEDTGYYRVYYKRKSDIGKKVHTYCIQNDGSWGNDAYKFYSCSKDGEPEIEIRFPSEDRFDKLIYPASIEKASK
jgi:hypothetical protein